MTLLKTLAAHFSPTRRLHGTEDSPVNTGGRFGGREWVIPRAQCQYRRLDMTAIPVRQRGAAARLALAAQLPSPAALTCVAWKQGIGHAWIWLDPPDGFGVSGQAWVAESLLAPLPSADGVRLLAMAAGVEGQVWRNGQLMVSQWWPAIPDDVAQGRFLRAAGFDDDMPFPEVETFQWQRETWAEQPRSWLPGTVDAQERLAWVGAAAVVALIAGGQIASVARWQYASTEMAERLEATRAEVAPVLAARERAESASSEAQALLALQAGGSDYELMSRVVMALPEGVELGSWRREPERIIAIVKNGPADPRLFVSTFVGKPPLDDVSASPVGAGMQLTFALAERSEEATP